MGIMTRMLRLCKADVHGVMDQLEDKQLLLKQYLREMEASLDQKERQIRTLSLRQQDLRRRIGRHKEEMEKLEGDLVLAVQREKDEIARVLIRRRRTLDSVCRHLQTQVETITQEERALAATLADQRLQYDTLKSQTDAYCQRTGPTPFPEQTDPIHGEWAPMNPKEEEIELELLQRKEALLKGGSS